MSHSGVTSYTIRLINSMPYFDHSIISCYSGSARKEINSIQLLCNVLLDKTEVKSRYIPIKYWKFLLYLLRMKFDIIHYHQGGIGILLLAIALGKKAKVNHHLHSGNLIGDNRKQDISVMHLLVLKFMSKYTTQIAVAEHVYNEYKSKINKTENLILIKNSVPFLFRTKETKKNAVGFISRSTREKGFYSFLTLSSQMDTFKLDLSIKVMGDLFSEPKKNIEIISPSFSVDEFYESIDLLLFTSTAPESLPLVILEAISFDVGVIAYPLKGVVEILGDNYPLYINNPIDAISKIDYFYSDDFDRQKLSDIHKKKSKMFNFDEMIRKINSLYNSLIPEN